MGGLKGMSGLKKAAVVLIILSLVVSLGLDIFRVQVESEYKQVQVLLDYDELRDLAAANGLAVEELALRFKKQGATGVMMRERTLEDLEKSGDIMLVGGAEAQILQELEPSFLGETEPIKENRYIVTKDKEVYQGLLRSLQADPGDVAGGEEDGYYWLNFFASEKDLLKRGVGFFPQDIKPLAEAGLSVVPRIRSYGSVCLAEVEEYLDLFTEYGTPLVAFNDEAIPCLGEIPTLAERLQEAGAYVGTFEFFEQQGMASLALQNEKNVVRIHSISENEMPQYFEEKALERFNLAVAERNIRALYVRFFGLEQPEAALERNLEFVGSIKADLAAEGFVIGEGQGPDSPPYSVWSMLIIGLGVIGGLLLWGEAVLSKKLVWAGGVAGLIGWVALLYLTPVLARKAFALLSVVVFPVIGITAVVKQKAAGEEKKFKQAVIMLLKIAGISLVGAMIMTGLLGDKSFMLKINGFSGVKLAHLLPLVAVPAYLLYDGEGAREIFVKLKKLLENPVLLGQVVGGALLLAALAVYLLRTGNDSGVLVTSWEMKMRSLLDQVLGVRPRTKEFLLGHPAMLLLLYYGYDRKDLKKNALLLLGTIGQVSLVNTYAHIHTPLVVSVIRSFHGLWLGVLLGVCAIVVINLCLRYLHNAESDAGE